MPENKKKLQVSKTIRDVELSCMHSHICLTCLRNATCCIFYYNACSHMYKSFRSFYDTADVSNQHECVIISLKRKQKHRIPSSIKFNNFSKIFFLSNQQISGAYLHQRNYNNSKYKVVHKNLYQSLGLVPFSYEVTLVKETRLPIKLGMQKNLEGEEFFDFILFFSYTCPQSNNDWARQQATTNVTRLLSYQDIQTSCGKKGIIIVVPSKGLKNYSAKE